MEKREKVVGEVPYVILLPPVRLAMPLCTRTALLLGPVMGSLAGQAEEGGWAKFAAACASVDPVKLDELVMDAVSAARLSAGTELINTHALFDRHFDSRRADVYEVCLWVLWECVRDFFPQLGAFTQLAQGMVEKAAASPSPKAGATTTSSAVRSGAGYVVGRT